MNRSFAACCAVSTAGAALIIVAGPAAAASSGTYYSNCSDAAAHGVYNIHRGQAGYRSALDRDSDGIACERASSSGSSSSSGSQATSSTGGSGSFTVNSGSGGQADRASSTVPAAVGGLGVLVLGGSAAAMTRRSLATRRG
jgi:hypothetical protein